MTEPEPAEYGITKEECDSLCAKKDKLRNYAFGISSAAGILTGIIYGNYISAGGYQTVVFVLFFGCFLGSLFGAAFTIAVVNIYTLFLYAFSPGFRNCRRYLSAKSKKQGSD